MTRVLISLVGEQPAPNLLPLRFLKPSDVVFVATERTQQVSKNLAPLTREMGVHYCLVHPYRVEEIRRALEAFISARGWRAGDLLFNVTGGTKPMALAAFGLAQEILAHVVYLQTEGNASLLYRYEFASNGVLALVKEDQIPETITLDDHLRMYLGTYREEGVREPFERAVVLALENARIRGITEVKAGIRPVGALEIDLVVRCGNQIGVGEIKSKSGKDGIDQLNSVASQRYLGTYLKKFLVVTQPLERNNAELAEAYSIITIVLPSGSTGELSAEDRETLINTMLTNLRAR
ncbi:MAG: DUF1887 family protein [Chloroflexota bacterium]|nr:DUF1887 family protein [Chloroflexota bacterium]